MRKTISLLSSAFLISLPCLAKGKQERKPNVLIIFSDQHRADVFGFQGHPDVKTPNLDKMAEKGVVYNRAYCQNAISVASRSSLFTGLYPRTLGYLDNTPVNNSVTRNTCPIQKMFRQNGYVTYAFGKRHLYGEIDEGWDHIKALVEKEGADNYVKWIEEMGYAEEFGEDWAAEFGRFPDGNSLEKKVFPTAQMGTRPTKLPASMTMEAYTASHTIEMIKQYGDKDVPFFCFTSFYRPHQPYNPLPEYLKWYDASRWGKGTRENDALAMPPTLRQSPEELPPFLAEWRRKEKGIWCLGKAAKDEQLYRNYIAGYYALVSEIDFWVGEIFKALEDSGLAENTIVIYMSDHGDFVGNHGMIEKAAYGHNVYEETLRVPLIFYWKNKIVSGYKCDDLVELVDIFPTLLDLTGIRLPHLKDRLQGKSLYNSLTKKESIKRDYIISENWSQATVVTKTHKLGIWLDPYPLKGRDWRTWGNMLFEYASDPYEVHNRINDVSMQKIYAKLLDYFSDFERRIPQTGKVECRQYFSTINN